MANNGAERIAIRHARVIDGSGRQPLENQLVIIEHGLIQALVPDPDVEISAAVNVDARGKTLMPGLIDMHAHLLSGGFDSVVDASASYEPAIQKRALEQMLYWGIVGCHYSVQPPSNGLWLRQALAAGELQGPRLFVSGPGVTAPNGWAGSNTPEARLELDEVDGVREAISALAKSGVDFIKVFYDDMCCAFHHSMPRLRKPVMERVIAETHGLGLPVAVHVYELDGHMDVMKAGADILYHSAVTGPIGDDYVALARDIGTAYVATLSIYHDTYDPTSLRSWADTHWVREAVPRSTLDTLAPGGPLDEFESFTRRENIARQYPNIMSNMLRVHDAGIPFAAGPDTGVPGVFPGLSIHREMELMVEAGVPPLAAIKAATSQAAALLAQPLLGRIANGMSANMILLRDDPIDDIRATRSIEAIWKGGDPVDRVALLGSIMREDAQHG